MQAWPNPRRPQKRWRLGMGSPQQVILVSLLAALLIVALVGLFATWPALASSQAGAPYKEIVVEPGDTLWEMAISFGRPDLDPRRIVWEIQQFNHLTGNCLYPGQVLRIPRRILPER